MEQIKKPETKKAIFLLTIILIFTLFLTANIKAGAPAGPTFTSNPVDNPDPVDEGNDVTFTATATDGNDDEWWLAICKTDAITEADPPTCPGGAYCISSSAVLTDTENNCAWTSTSSGAWYGFACDTPLDGCSASVAGDITVNAAPDTTNPDINIVYPSNNSNHSNVNLNVNFTRSDTNLQACWYSNDTYLVNKTLPSCGNVTDVVWSQGKHNVTIWANDTNGNINNSKISFTIDTIKPNIDITFPSNNSNSSNTALDVNYTTSDNRDLVNCWYSNDTYLKNTSLTDCGTNITTIIWSEGQHNVTIWSNDSAGNINNSKISFTIDLTFPDISIVFPSNNSNSSNVNLDVNYTTSDNVGLFNCWYSNDTYLANISLTNCGTNITTIIWSEGQHNVTIWSNDSAGNINNSKISFKIDTTLPTVSNIMVNDLYLSETDIAVNGFVATIDFSELMDEATTPTIGFTPAVATTLTNCGGVWSDSNTYTYTCDIADADVESADIDIDVSGAKDLAGNAMTADTTTGDNEFSVDTLLPTISIVFPSNNSNSSNINLNVNYTASDTNLAYCWYSNDTMSVNTSLATCGTNITTVTWSEGQHNVTVWTNDTSGNINNSKISFTIDTTPPYFTTFTDQTIIEEQSLNYDINAADDGVGLESFAINWTTQFNITISDGILRNSSGLSIGNYYINVSINDTVGNLNSSVLLIQVTTGDAVAPNITTLTETPTDPQTYSPGKTYQFNATIQDTGTISIVLLEFNGTNYTASTIGGNVYNVTLVDLSTSKETPFNYRWFANDTNENTNNSETGTYTVNKNSSLVLGLVGTTPIEYPATTDFTGSDCPSQLTCTQNITNGIFSAGTISSNYSTIGNANYSASSTDFTVTINKNSSLVLGLSATTPIEYPTITDFTGSDCPSELSCSLNISNIIYSAGTISSNYSTIGNTNYSASSTDFTVTIDQNSSLVLGISGSTPIIYGTVTDVAGSLCPSELSCSLDKTNIVYEVGIETFNYSTSGNTNYSASSITKDITINQATLTGSLAGTTPINYGNTGDVTGTEANSGDEDCIYKLYRDDVEVSNPDATILSVGVFNYIYNTTGCTNYSASASLDTFELTVNKVSLSASLTNDRAWTFTYDGTPSNIAYSETNTGDGDVTYTIHKDSANVESSDVEGSVGIYSYLINSTGGDNYSASASLNSNTLTINQASPIGALTNSLTTWTINETQEVIIGLSQTNDGDDDLTYIVYRDGVSKTTGETWSPTIGTYEYILNTTGGTNWSANANMDTQTLTVLDNIFPNINITTPINNTNWSNINLNVNFTRSDTNLFNCWYSNDTYLANTSLTTSCNNITSVVWSEGQHNVTIWANDSGGNANNSKISFTIDATPPYFTTFANQAIPETNSLNYNIDATDNGVGIESFAINWTTQFNITISEGILRNSSGLSIGEYYINVSINDTLGNLNSSILLVNVTEVDLTKPNINITFPTNNSNSSDINLDVKFTRSDNNGVLNCWYSNDTYLANTSLTTNCNNITSVVWSEGNHNITIWANDTSGNINNSKISFTINTAPPYFDEALTNQTYVQNASVKYNINASDTYPGLGSYAVNDTNFGINSTGWLKNSTTLNVKEYYINISINDTVDNVNSTILLINITAIPDNLNPNISIIFPSNNSNWTNVNLNINFTRVDLNLESCWYSNDTYLVNSTPDTNCNNITNVVWSEGKHNVTIWANDSSNNLNSSRISFTIDTVKPDINITYPINNTNWTNTNLDVNYTASDSGTGLESCWYSNDSHSTNITLADCSTNITTITWSEGQHNVIIWANDTVGNKNSSSIIFTIDSVPPSFTKIKNLAIHNGSSLNYDIDANDVTNNIDCFTLNDTTNFEINCSGWLKNSTATHSKLGNYYVNITVNDTLNNINSEVIRINIVQMNQTEFSGNTTDFSNVTDLSNITNLIIENPLCGKINFSEPINLENGTDLDNYVNISNNRIEINSSAFPNLNKSATITLNDLTFTTPRILRDDVVCPSTICTGQVYSANTLTFNVTHFTVYEAEETPATSTTTPPVGGGGTSDVIIAYECTNNSECEGNDEVCLNNQCIKLFDVKIIDFESPIKLGEFFDFTYFIKGMANISGDVEINFWIEKGDKKVTSGSDVIYLGNFEEKTETTKIFLPSSVESGVYQFIIEVNYGNYVVQSHRTVEIQVQDGTATIFPFDKKEIKTYLIYALIILILILIFYMKKRKFIPGISQENIFFRKNKFPEQRIHLVSRIKQNIVNAGKRIKIFSLKLTHKLRILLLEKRKEKILKTLHKKKSAEQLIKEIRIKKQPIIKPKIKIIPVKNMKETKIVKEPLQEIQIIQKPKSKVFTQIQEKKTTTQLIEEINAKKETKKQKRTNLFKEQLYKKPQKIFKKREPTQEKNIIEDNLEALEEMFGEHKEKPEKNKNQSFSKRAQEKTKDELDKIIDRMGKNKNFRKKSKEKTKEELDDILDQIDRKNKRRSSS